MCSKRCVALASVLLLAVCGFALSGCAKPAKKAPAKPAVYDLGVGLLGPNQAAGGDASLRFDVASGATFKANYVADAQSGGTKLLIIALDNGKQIDFTLNGTAGTTHTIVALTGTHSFPAAFGPFADGLHNIVVVAIADPEKHQLDKAWRAGTEFMSYPTKVVSLSVGGSTLAGKPAGAAGGESVPDSAYGSVALAPTNSMELTTWTKRTAHPGEQFDAYVHLGNPSTSPIPYALSVLLDGRQIAIESVGIPAVSGTLVAGQRLIMPVKITAPDKPGTYELMAIAGINPFVQQPKTTGAKNTTFYFGSSRTALIVN